MALSPDHSSAHHLVAIGAGHAHLHLARHTAALARHGITLTLIDPDRFWYSGLATGMLGGQYTPADDQIDPQHLVEPRGRFLRERMTGLDRNHQRVLLASGNTVPYDYLSLNVGSEVATGRIEGCEHAWLVKPIANLARLREALEARLVRGAQTRVTVIGGGATGCEVAANLLALAHRSAARMDVRLFSASDRLLPEAPKGAGRFMRRMLERRGVACEFGRRIARIEPTYVCDEAGQRWASDLTVLATGLTAPAWLGALGLPLGERGGLQVEPTLCSASDARIFATGDCIDFIPQPLPKLGVFGVRQAPVLMHNLVASVEGRPLRPYRPQRRWLSILNLGDGRALATWGPLYLHGRACMKWKNHLDQTFLKRHRPHPLTSGQRDRIG